MQYLCGGYNRSLEEVVNGALFASDNDEMVIVKDIELYSLCEHHILPFIGKAHVAYIPTGDALAGCDVDEGLLHLGVPLAQPRRVDRLAGKPLDLFQAGAYEVFAADGAVVGQFQGEGCLRLQRCLRLHRRAS